MKKRMFLVVTATALFTLSGLPAVHAQGIPNTSLGSPRVNEDAVQVSALGRVQSDSSGSGFTLQVKNLLYRVSYAPRGNRVEVRRGDRVRVVGEIEEADRIVADQVLIVERGRGSRTSGVLSGTIRNIDRENQQMTIATEGGGTARVTWGDDVEFYRNTPAAARASSAPATGCG